ncbi:MAG: hypothetical protein QNJ77_05235 [Acidimicrobiia bacterium]|nr:hypothetical protein [Acidimicrobiia bacterium]
MKVRSGRAVARLLILVLLLAACGGSDDAAEVEDAGPPEVTFDGTVCTVESGPIAAGLAEVSVFNMSSNPGEAWLILLGDGYQLSDLESDVAAGRFDQYGLAGNDDPSGWDDFIAARMSASMTEPLLQPFAASTGTWGVVCADFLDLKAVLGSGVVEVS